VAGGIELYVQVAFRLVEWPWTKKGALSLVVQPCEVTARTRRGELKLGIAIPTPTNVIVPPSHSSTTTIGFSLTLGASAVASLEASRDGRELELLMPLVANPIYLLPDRRVPDYVPGIDVRPTRVDYAFKVPRDQWIAALVSSGYCETLVTELRLPSSGPEPLSPGRQRLSDAVKARNDGGYAEAMRRCRIALDEVQKTGFGGKAPAEVAQFLQERAGTMSQSERLSALRVALQLFLSPAHHANAPDEHYTREDAELAIALTAALLRLAAIRLVDDGGGESPAPDGSPK
jgi:hypothetical protein